MSELKLYGDRVLQIVLRQAADNGIDSDHLKYEVEGETDPDQVEIVYKFGDVYLSILSGNEVHVGGHGDYSVFEPHIFNSLDDLIAAVSEKFVEYKRFEIKHPKGPLRRRFWAGLYRYWNKILGSKR